MSTTRRRRGLPTAFVVACVALGALVSIWAALWLAALSVEQTDRTTRTYRDVDSLRIDGGTGDIAVIAEDRDDVEVRTKVTWGLGKPKIDQRFDGGSIRLRSECGFWGAFGPHGCTADFEVRVPRGLPVDLRASSGDATATGLAGATRLSTSSGDLRAVDVAGPLHVSASSGDVVVEGYRGRDVRAAASSGDVTVRTRVAPRRLKATAASGDVTVVVPGSAVYDVEARAISGDTSVDVDERRGAPHLIDASASSGDVRVARLDDAR